jgi:hypothetical protein
MYSIETALGLTVVMIGIDLLGLVSGMTLFFGFVNLVHIVLHSIGTILTSFFIIETWHYMAIWWIWGVFSCIPTIIEILAILSVTCLKVHRY